MNAAVIGQLSKRSIRQMLVVLPIFFVAVFIGVLIDHFLPPEFAQQYLGDQTWWAIPVAAVVGVVLPIPRYVTYPIAFALFTTGAGVGVAFSLICGEVISTTIVRDAVEIKYFGWRFYSVRMALSIIAIAIGGFIIEAIL